MVYEEVTYPYISATMADSLSKPTSFKYRVPERIIIERLQKQVNTLKEENKKLKAELAKGGLSVVEPNKRGRVSIVETGQLSIKED